MTDDELHNDMTQLGERMDRLEMGQAKMGADVAEIKKAILGDLHGHPGVLVRVHDVENLSRGNRAEIKAAQGRIAKNTQWRENVQAQWRLLMALGGGNLLGLLYLIYRITQISP